MVGWSYVGLGGQKVRRMRSAVRGQHPKQAEHPFLL